jgi:hypothetical protein
LAAALRWNPAAEPLIASAAALLFSYGAWGLLDRSSSRISSRGWLRTAQLFEALCVLSAILGVMAAAGVLLAVWAIALGTWIS